MFETGDGWTRWLRSGLDRCFAESIRGAALSREPPTRLGRNMTPTIELNDDQFGAFG